jgi:hypothetical protein
MTEPQARFFQLDAKFPAFIGGLSSSQIYMSMQSLSEIVNIVTTTDRLFQYANEAQQAQADPATKEALCYRAALHKEYGLQQSVKRRQSLGYLF